MAEVGAGFFVRVRDVCGPGGDGHKAFDTEVFEGGEGIEQGGEVGGVKAMLGVFGREFYFEKNGKDLAESLGGVVEAGGEAEGVDGVDGLEELCGGGGFVGLERADEVHVDVGGGVGGLGLPLLDAVFAEEALAGGVGFEQGGEGVHLAHCHQCNGGGVSVGAGAGFGDRSADLLEVCCDGHAGLILLGRMFTAGSSPAVKRSSPTG